MSFTVNEWIYNIKNSLEKFGDEKYQKKAWIEGKGKHSFESYYDAISRLYDHNLFVEFISCLKLWGFSIELIKTFNKFESDLTFFHDNEAINKSDLEIISNQKWYKIIKDAQVALIIFQDELQKLNISDDLLAPLKFDLDEEI